MDSVPSPATAVHFTESIRRYRTATGPWGELEYVRVAVARPDPYVYVSLADASEARWRFTGRTVEQIEGIFQRAGLTTEQARWLCDPERCKARDGYYSVTPGADFILGLPGGIRVKLYAELGADPANPYHTMPLSWRADGIEEWWEDGGLSGATIDLINHLLYPRGNALCLSDLPTLVGKTTSDEEKTRIIKTLSRSNSVLLRLRVPYGADVDSLADYWALGGRAKDVRPLLESLAQVPGGASVDVGHLLPAFCRSRLYTFEYPPRRGTHSKANCFWTAMNFFSEVPDDRFTDGQETLAELQRKYLPVQGPAQLGDVHLFTNQSGVAVHAAVYIADDVLFTKNGHDHNAPWMFMRRDDLLARYAQSPPMKVTCYRSVDLQQPLPAAGSFSHFRAIKAGRSVRDVVNR